MGEFDARSIDESLFAEHFHMWQPSVIDQMDVPSLHGRHWPET